MAIQNRWRIWCNTESAYVYVWSATQPTVCPNDPLHSIDSDSIIIIERNEKPVNCWNSNIDPTVNDDETKGHILGSLWLNTSTKEEFICVDATTSNAVWKRNFLEGDILGEVVNFTGIPFANGDLDITGWHIVTDTSISLISGTPVTMSAACFYSHVVLEISGASGLPFTIRLTGTSVDLSETVTPGDIEDITISANGYYQSTKSWIDAVEISIVESSKSCTLDQIIKTAYWHDCEQLFYFLGLCLEFTPDSNNWAMHIKIYRINSDGSKYEIENKYMDKDDAILRADAYIPARYNKGGYNIPIDGGSQEGFVIEVYQEQIASYKISVKYGST